MFKNLRENINRARTPEALNEIKRIAKRKLFNIIIDKNIKNSIKNGAKRQYKSLLQEIKRKSKHI